MVEMELLGVKLELPVNMPVLLLREQGDDRRVLPIYIAQPEAQSIQWALEGKEPPRPMTHDLMRDLLNALSARVTRVVITELRESDAGGGTFFAEIELDASGRELRVSSRPSDAVALAVRVGAPIFAEEAVLAAAASAVEEDDDAEEQEEIVDQFREFLDDVNPEDFAS
ncbi:MAG: bifunctional nuclease family protein [Acidobacteria bacterium]|nr:bifunctional nuclease family protein [Acidobacteriota bacterium]